MLEVSGIYVNDEFFCGCEAEGFGDIEVQVKSEQGEELPEEVDKDFIGTCGGGGQFLECADGVDENLGVVVFDL